MIMPAKVADKGSMQKKDSKGKAYCEALRTMEKTILKDTLDGIEVTLCGKTK